MAGDNIPQPSPEEIDKDEATVSGQTGRLFGALIVIGLLLALGAFFAFGDIHAIEWIWAHNAR